MQTDKAVGNFNFECISAEQICVLDHRSISTVTRCVCVCVCMCVCVCVCMCACVFVCMCVSYVLMSNEDLNQFPAILGMMLQIIQLV